MEFFFYRYYNSTLINALYSNGYVIMVLAVRLPPTIVKSPMPLIIYRMNGEVTLECVATGEPTPT